MRRKEKYYLVPGIVSGVGGDHNVRRVLEEHSQSGTPLSSLEEALRETWAGGLIAIEESTISRLKPAKRVVIANRGAIQEILTTRTLKRKLNGSHQRSSSSRKVS